MCGRSRDDDIEEVNGLRMMHGREAEVKIGGQSGRGADGEPKGMKEVYGGGRRTNICLRHTDGGRRWARNARRGPLADDLRSGRQSEIPSERIGSTQ